MVKVNNSVAFNFTGLQSVLKEGFEYVPPDLKDALGEDKSREVLNYANELKDGKKKNLGKLISLLEEAKKEMPKNKLGDLSFLINDFIDGTDKDIRADVIAEIKDSSLGSLFKDKNDANSQDFKTTELANYVEENRTALKEELKDLNDGEKTGPKLQEMIKTARELYGNDDTKVNDLLRGVFAGYKGMGFNVAGIKGNEVTEVAKHEYNAKNGALDEKEKNIIATQKKFVKIDDVTTATRSDEEEDHDENTRSSGSSGRSNSDINMSSIFDHNKRDMAYLKDSENRHRRFRNQRLRNEYGGNHYVHDHGHGPHSHIVGPGHHHHHHGNSIGRSGIFGDLRNIFGGFTQLYALGNGLGHIFNGNYSTGFNFNSAGEPYAELRSINNHYDHPDGYLYGGLGGFGGLGYPVNYGAVTGGVRNPNINVSPVINIDNTSSSNSNPYVNQTGAPIAVNTNTPVSVPNSNYNHNFHRHLGLPFYG